MSVDRPSYGNKLLIECPQWTHDAELSRDGAITYLACVTKPDEHGQRYINGAWKCECNGAATARAVYKELAFLLTAGEAEPTGDTLQRALMLTECAVKQQAHRRHGSRMRQFRSPLS